jgi:hypothetical protein
VRRGTGRRKMVTSEELYTKFDKKSEVGVPVASLPSAPLEMTLSLQGALQIKAMFLIFFDESS